MRQVRIHSKFARTGGLETPAVVFFQGQYHLFYTGYPYLVTDPLHSALDYRVGHAVSNDGVTFTRTSTLPLVSPSGATQPPWGADAWNAWISAEPAPVVFNGELLYPTHPQRRRLHLGGE